MNILALESSSRRGSIAALKAADSGVQLVADAWLSDSLRSAQTLAPAIQNLLQQVGWKPADVELIAVTTGPGSFTGLRIGVTTAKTFAYATGAQVVGVDTLHVLALQAPAKAAPLWAVLDAHRHELFAAKFQLLSDDFPQTILDSRVLGRDEWIKLLAPGDSLTGPVLESLRSVLPPNVAVVDRELWHPRAAAVGKLGWQAHHNGRSDDLWQLVPRYFRPSAAEEKWNSGHIVPQQ